MMYQGKRLMLSHVFLYIESPLRYEGSHGNLATFHLINLYINDYLLLGHFILAPNHIFSGHIYRRNQNICGLVWKINSYTDTFYHQITCFIYNGHISSYTTCLIGVKYISISQTSSKIDISMA